MFGFAPSEIALVVVVALVLIGPKDLPHAIRAVVRTVRKMRGMAGEFQTHVDDLIREADLGEMRQELASLRGLDVRSQIARAIDPTAVPRANPIDDPPIDITERPEPTILRPARPAPPPDHLRPPPDRAPACIPPSLVAAERKFQAAPAFVPPRVAGA